MFLRRHGRLALFLDPADRILDALPLDEAHQKAGDGAVELQVTRKPGAGPTLFFGVGFHEPVADAVVEFAFPLSFLALMFAAIKDKAAVIAALVGGTTAIIAKGLPYNLGLTLAATLGIAAGVFAEKKMGGSK